MLNRNEIYVIIKDKKKDVIDRISMINCTSHFEVTNVVNYGNDFVKLFVKNAISYQQIKRFKLLIAFPRTIIKQKAQSITRFTS